MCWGPEAVRWSQSDGELQWARWEEVFHHQGETPGGMVPARGGERRPVEGESGVHTRSSLHLEPHDTRPDRALLSPPTCQRRGEHQVIMVGLTPSTVAVVGGPGVNRDAEVQQVLH